MNIQSLALKTDLIFHRFSAEVSDKGDYIAIKTPDRPSYFWGNYLIFQDPPKPGDLEKWVALFEKEVGPKSQTGFVALTWDADEKGDSKEFLEAGFELQCSEVMSAKSLTSPKYLNPDAIIRPLFSEKDWQAHEVVHFSPDWEYGTDDGQRAFLKNARQELQAMVEQGLGLRFGAELNTQIVAELGIYWDGPVGRFNTVGTHIDFRRQGLCQTLVYKTSQMAFEKGIETLVIEADHGEPAARIYKSLGFELSEKRWGLQWHDPSMF